MSAETIAEQVREAFSAAGLSEGRICKAATIDLKANEPGILMFCEEKKNPLEVFSAEQLMAVQGEFSASAFVQQTTGADNVCERSAVLESGGKLLLPKNAKDGVTVAAAEMPLLLDFNKRRTF